MDLGRFLLRGVVGPLFVGHGTQKLFGWFGGHGPDATGGFFESLGLRPGKRHATAAPSVASASPLPFRPGNSFASTEGLPGPVSVIAAIAAISARLYS